MPLPPGPNAAATALVPAVCPLPYANPATASISASDQKVCARMATAVITAVYNAPAVRTAGSPHRSVSRPIGMKSRSAPRSNAPIKRPTCPSERCRESRQNGARMGRPKRMDVRPACCSVVSVSIRNPDG